MIKVDKDPLFKLGKFEYESSSGTRNLQILMRYYSRLYTSNVEEHFSKPAMRPSSAKSNLSASSTVEIVDVEETKQDIKPSVLGLKHGRKVFGHEASVQAAWKNDEKDFPFKLKNEEEINKLQLLDTHGFKR